MTADWEQVTRLDRSGLVTWLLSAEPDHVQWTGNEWLGVLQLFTTQLTQEGAEVSPVAWRTHSVAYDVVLRRTQDTNGIDEHEAAVRRLLLTSVALGHARPTPEVALLDPRHAIAAFRACLPMPTEVAVRVAPQWRELAPADLRRLVRAAGLVTAAGALKPYLDESDPGSSDFAAELAVWERDVLVQLRSGPPSC
ncbi:hypothetical protein AB0B85_33125 [Micromonospora sp. NPDC049044]|uniref:hypothetical protein n=1 Tax=unclassified Micromonospora TaxID=2617518 RepID=UPI0033F3FE5F